MIVVVGMEAARQTSIDITLDGHVVRRATPDDVGRMQALFETDPGYFLVVELAPLRADEGREIFDERPAVVPPERKHLFLVATPSGDDIALLDFLEGFPEPHIWYLGLIFLAPSARGRGLGTALIRALGDGIRGAGGTAMRLAVMHGNPDARRLYDRLGFQFVAEKIRTSWNGATAPVDVLQLALV